MSVAEIESTPHEAALAQHKQWLHKTILRFIHRYLEKNHCAPSWDEIAEAAGFASKSGVTRHVQEMAELGLIYYHPGRYRSLAVTPAGLQLIGK
jgi:SOS-response transcriptional repressor LexA